MEKTALERWNNGDPSGFLEISAEDVVYFDPMTERRLDGHGELTELYESLRGKIRANRYEMIHPLVQATDSMAVLTLNLISWTDDTEHAWNCTEVYRLENDGKWKSIQTHWSLTQSLPALSFLPQHPGNHGQEIIDDQDENGGPHRQDVFIQCHRNTHTGGKQDGGRGGEVLDLLLTGDLQHHPGPDKTDPHNDGMDDPHRVGTDVITQTGFMKIHHNSLPQRYQQGHGPAYQHVRAYPCGLLHLFPLQTDQSPQGRCDHHMQKDIQFCVHGIQNNKIFLKCIPLACIPVFPYI